MEDKGQASIIRTWLNLFAILYQRGYLWKIFIYTIYSLPFSLGLQVDKPYGEIIRINMPDIVDFSISVQGFNQAFSCLKTWSEDLRSQAVVYRSEGKCPAL